MSETERVINDLNVAKLILRNPQMLTPEMCIRIGQAITSSIVLLKEKEAMEQCLKTKCVICLHCDNCDVDENGQLKEQEVKQQFDIDIPLKERNDNFDLYDTPIFGFHD